jgi:3-hydroxyisobutyrate dehydrogenase
MNERVGIVGLGVMGTALCERFLAEKYHVTGFNRTKKKEHNTLISSGINIVNDIRSLVEGSDVVIFVLSDARAIQDVLKDMDLASVSEKIFIQMGTIAPHESVEIGAVIAHSGNKFIEAPVMGSVSEIKSGTLISIVGGDSLVLEEVKRVLGTLSSSIRYAGDVGSGAALKLAMNQLTASLTSAFSISLAFCRENGVDVGVFMDTVRESALYAKTYDKKLSKYLSRDFGSANFSPKHLLKDVRLFLREARILNLETSAVEGVESIASQAVKNGLSHLDYSSIYNIIHPKKE